MTAQTTIPSAVACYTRILKNIRKAKLPPHYPLPCPAAQWPAANQALFERYLAWLIADGAGQQCIVQYYLPIGGHVLGYHLQPHPQLDLDSALARVTDFLHAKQYSERSLSMGQSALDRFRRFMHDERGLVDIPEPCREPDVTHFHGGLPPWLVEQLTHYQHLRQGNWRPTRLKHAIIRFWYSHTRLWRWLLADDTIQQISDIKRAHLFAYIDERLAAGYTPAGINCDMRTFQATLRFLQERDFAVPRALLHLPGLKEPDALPRFLTDEQVARLQTEVEQQARTTSTPTGRRNALLDRAAFYLMWHGGLRLGEVEELQLGDLDLAHKQLIVRRGKGLKDRAVCLTDMAVAAVRAYLQLRGTGRSTHLFLFRHRPLSKDLIRSRIKAIGRRCGVPVTPHQLRHTYATQLVNAGCRITTIQALLGHAHLNTTMTYARVHDRTAADDYSAAMAVVEQRLAPYLHPSASAEAAASERDASGFDPQHLLHLADTLQAEPLSAAQHAALDELRHALAALALPSAEQAPPGQCVVGS
jgi:site-specific recombinase XerD